MQTEDEATLAKAPARRREEVRAALQDLRLLRENWAGTPDEKLPPEVRQRAQAATLVVRQATQSPVSVAKLAIALLFAGISAGLAIYQPVIFYTFSTQGDGELRCTIRERSLGLVPMSAKEVPGVVSATAESRRESREQTDSDGQRRSVRTTVQTLSLLDAAGQTIREWRLEYLLGANFPDVARRVEELAHNPAPSSLVRWTAVWPALLAATLFGFIGFAMLWSELTDGLSWLGFTPLLWLNSGVVSIGVHALVLAAVAAAWGIAVLGGDPPAWLVTALRVGP